MKFWLNINEVAVAVIVPPAKISELDFCFPFSKTPPVIPGLTYWKYKMKCAKFVLYFMNKSECYAKDIVLLLFPPGLHTQSIFLTAPLPLAPP